MEHRGPFAALLLAATVLAAGCASSNPAPQVPVQGSDLSALAGRWVGDYSSTETGRTGSIVFELRSGESVAHGDVLMKPKEEPQTGTAPPGSGAALRTMPQMLNISFVNATGGVLRGTMDPYRDPACDCMVQTTFVGRLQGDVIEGTFTTTPQGSGAITSGHWKMTREKK